MMNINQIMKILPHRYPFLLIDRVLSREAGKRIVALKNVTANEPYFQGHFPGTPIMPGVLIMESLAQCAVLMFETETPDTDGRLFLFGGIDKARFRKPVIPGDQLILEVEVIQKRSTSARVRGVAKVDGVTVAEGEILSVLGPKMD